MTKGFDAYYKWLGIPPKDQPPNHYRLLGIELFESDREVIDAAANRVMAYLKDLAVGDDAEHSQKLLNEAARARVCLLAKDKKTAYDQALREALDAVRADSAGPGPPPWRASRVPVPDPAELVPPAITPPREVEAAAPLLRPSPSSSLRQPPPVGKRKNSQPFSPMVVGGAGLTALALGCLVLLALVTAGPDPHDLEPAGNAAPGHANVGRVPEPDAPRTTKPFRPRVRPHPPRLRSPFESPDSPLPPLSEGLAKATDTRLSSPAEMPPGERDVPSAEQSLDPSDRSSADGQSTEPLLTKPAAETAAPKSTVDGEARSGEPNALAKGVWGDLPALISLSSPSTADAAERASLGQVHFAPGQSCSLRLLGGEKVCRGSQAIVAKPVTGEQTTRHWEILIRGPEADSETKIARLGIDDEGQFELAWESVAAAQPATSQLINCVLELASGGETHRMRLRDVTAGDELVLDLTQPTHKSEWKLNAAPNPEVVKVELLGFGSLRTWVEPSGPLPAEKGEAWVQVQDGGNLLLLRVETSLKRSLQVEVTPYLKLSPNAKPERLLVKKLPQLLAQATASHQQLVARIEQLRQVLHRGSLPAAENTALEQQLKVSETLQIETEKNVARLRELEMLLKAHDNKLRVPIRMYYDADGCEVELLRAGDSAAPPRPPGPGAEDVQPR